MSTVERKVKTTVEEETRRVRQLATHAVKSKAYLYPIKVSSSRRKSR